MTALVDHLPEEVFIDDPPASPPLFSPKDSSDSLPTELSNAGPKDTYPGSQVVTELLHTERKYVQDLETMQVRMHSKISSQRVSHSWSNIEVCNFSRSDEYNRPRHITPAFPGTQQTTQLSATVPDKIGEYLGAPLE